MMHHFVVSLLQSSCCRPQRFDLRLVPANLFLPLGFDDRTRAMLMQAARKVIKRMHYPLEVIHVRAVGRGDAEAA